MATQLRPIRIAACARCGAEVETRAGRGQKVYCSSCRVVVKAEGRHKYYKQHPEIWNYPGIPELRLPAQALNYRVVECPNEEFPAEAEFSRLEMREMLRMGHLTQGMVLSRKRKRLVVVGDELSEQKLEAKP